MLVPGEDIAANQQSIRVIQHVLGSAVKIALYGEGVEFGRPIGAKSSLSLRPAVMGARAIREFHRTAMKSETVHAIRGIAVDSIAVSRTQHLLLIARAGIDERALRQVRGSRDDVDDPVHGVCPP